MVRIFISHSSLDRDVVDAFIKLLDRSLRLPVNQIRCTSLDGFRLPAGADFEHNLRSELLEADIFIALISLESLYSTFVLFELGARWGANQTIIPLLVPPIRTSDIERPLNSLNALSCSSCQQVRQLLGELARQLRLNIEPPEMYSEAIDQFVAKSKEKTMFHGTWIGWIHIIMENKYRLIIENYIRNRVGISIKGRSYNPQLISTVNWCSTSALFNANDQTLYVTYRTTKKESIYKETVTRGMGVLHVEGRIIKGDVFDRPEKLDKETFRPRFFTYHLVKIDGREDLSFGEVRNTMEFTKVRGELSKLSNEWALP